MSNSTSFITGVLVSKAMSVANTWFAIGTVPTSGEFGTIGFTVVNTDASSPVSFNLAISAATTPSEQDTIESNVTLSPGGVLERTQIIANAGETLFIQASSSTLAVRLYGVTQLSWGQLPTQFAQEIQSGEITYSPDTSTVANSIVVEYTPVPPLQNGTTLQFTLANTNTGPCTVSVNGTSYPLITVNGPLNGGVLKAGNVYQMIYQAGSFVITSGLNTSGNFNGVVILQASATLEDNAYGCAIQANTNGIIITLPANEQIGGVLWFYANQGPGETYTIQSNTGQFIFSPSTGQSTATTGNSITINNGESVYLMSRGSGEWDIIGGSYLITNASEASIAGTLTVNNLVAGQRHLLINGNTNPNWLPNSSFTYGPTGLAAWEIISGNTNGGSVNGAGSNANYYYLSFNGTSVNGNSISYQVQSDPIYAPSVYDVGSYTNLSLLIFNGYSTGNVNSGGVASVELQYFDSSGTYISTGITLSAPINTSWNFYTGTSVSPTNSAYAIIVISGTGPASTTVNANIAFSQIKLEYGTTPTFWTDESSALLFNNSSHNLYEHSNALYGYAVTPTGTIVQWGGPADGVTPTNTGTSAAVTWNLPITFPNGAFTAIGTDGGDMCFRYGTAFVNNSTLKQWCQGNSGAWEAGASYWFAIGY